MLGGGGGCTIIALLLHSDTSLFINWKRRGSPIYKKSSTSKGQVSEERGIEWGRKILIVFNWLNDFYPKDDAALTLKVIDIFLLTERV